MSLAYFSRHLRAKAVRRQPTLGASLVEQVHAVGATRLFASSASSSIPNANATMFAEAEEHNPASRQDSQAERQEKRLAKLRRMASYKPELKKGTNPLAFADVLTSKQFDRASIEAVMTVATEMHAARAMQKKLDLCRGLILGNLFFEPSTRTACSFATAMMRLGGEVVQLDASTSSAQKGETFTDTIRVMENYTDCVVMRHPTVGSVAKAAEVAENPVINAGDGKGEHPTQALLDIFTILQERDVASPDGLTVTMVGDLKNGRTVHSLSRLLKHFDNISINYVAPDVLRMPREYIEEIEASGVKVREMESYRDVIGETDVFYMTRVQKERFETELEYERCKGLYVLTKKDMDIAAKEMIVLHPLPRVDEIDMEVDADPRAAYFRQAGCGLSLRMALLAMCLNKVDMGKHVI